MRFELRRLTLEDVDAMVETVRQGFESFQEWAAPGWTPPPMEPELVREGLSRPQTWGLLATRDGDVAGHVAFTQAREREEPRADIPGLAHLWQLFVRRDWWGTALAADLNRRAVAEAKAQGYARMRLGTPLGNARARRFYEREGWTTDGMPVPEPRIGLELVEYFRPLR